MDITSNDEDQEPQNMNEFRCRNDWLKWKEAIQTELKSLAKREVFGPVVQTPKDINLLATNGSLYESEMSKMKSCDIKHALWPKASHKDMKLIIRRRIRS